MDNLINENRNEINGLDYMLESIDPKNVEIINFFKERAKDKKTSKLNKFTGFRHTLEQIEKDPVKVFLMLRGKILNENNRIIGIIRSGDKRNYTWSKIFLEDKNTGERFDLNVFILILVGAETMRGEAWHLIRRNYTDTEQMIDLFLKVLKIEDYNDRKTEDNTWEQIEEIRKLRRDKMTFYTV